MVQVLSSDVYGAMRPYVVPLLCLVLSVSACSTTRELSSTPRSPVEQLLITQSIVRSLDVVALPLLPGDTVALETVGMTDDKNFGRDVIAGWLGRRGVFVGGGEPVYSIRIIWHTLGAEKSETFFGMPPIQSTLLPFATPELSFYKATRLRGYTRCSLDIVEKKTGQLLASTPLTEADVHFSRYTVLLVFVFDSTDMMPPPL
jgi:hypothetical protein